MIAVICLALMFSVTSFSHCSSSSSQSHSTTTTLISDVDDFKALGGDDVVILTQSQVKSSLDVLGKELDLENIPRISDTLRIMDNLEELGCQDVTQRTEIQAAIVTQNAVIKKKEKQEKQANLTFRLQMYRAEIQRTVDQQKTLLHELDRQLKRSEEEEYALDKIDREELKEVHETKSMKYYDIPDEIDEAITRRKEDRQERRNSIAKGMKECQEQLHRVNAKLEANKAKLTELQNQRDLTQQEQDEIATTITLINQGISVNAAKFSTIAPNIATDSIRDRKDPSEQTVSNKLRALLGLN